MEKLLTVLSVLCCTAASALAQTAVTLPIAANAIADLGNGPIKVRMIAGNASIFTSQGSGVGSTSGSSTALTLTGTPTTPPIVGGLISGAGITSGTTVAAYNGTTGITLSAAMTVAGGTAVAWGAACPSTPPSTVIQASAASDYYIMYTQARVCAVSPGGPVNTLLVDPIFYDQTSPGNAIRSATTADTILPSDCGGTVQEGTGSTGFFTVTLPAASGFPVGCVVIITDGDTGRAKRLLGFPQPNFGFLYPLQTTIVGVVNGAWTAIRVPGRWKVIANTPFFVDSALGADTNDCLAAGAGACATSLTPLNRIMGQLDITNAIITLQFAAGQSWSNFAYNGGLFGMLASVTIDGGGSTFTSASAAEAVQISSLSGQLVTLQNMIITNSSTGDGLYVHQGNVVTGAGMVFGATGRYQIHTQYTSLANMVANYTINGPAQSHIFTEDNSTFNLNTGAVVTISGTPAFSAAFAQGITSSTQAYFGTFSGSATGKRYLLASNSVIDTSGAGPTYLPGNAVGSVSKGGNYDSPGTPVAAFTGGTAAPAVTGTDVSGHLTEGAASTGGTITFTTGNAPNACSVNTSSATVQVGLVYTLTSTVLTISHPSASGAVIGWTCPPN